MLPLSSDEDQPVTSGGSESEPAPSQQPKHVAQPGPSETPEPTIPPKPSPPPQPTNRPEPSPAPQPSTPPEPSPPPEPSSAPQPSPPPVAERPAASSIRAGQLTVEQHLETILRGVGPLTAYDQPLIESLGLPVHEDFTSPYDLPRFDNSSMDGYAVRAQDIVGASQANPITLPVVGSIAAGSARPFAISAGTAVKIMTGSPIPKGADTIVPLEATDGGKSRVLVYAAIPERTYIRPRADDVAVGDVVVEAGAVLGPREVGLLASLGAARVKARPRPRVVVISTGSELREPGSHLDYDSIFDGNSYMLAAACRAAGAIAYRVPGVKDDPKEFRRALSDQLVRADLVVTSGGISKGDYDVVKEALQSQER